ncbi:MAG: PQQ-binding-like beta-propeller repeat protein [Planctomycetaceae bacterium]
MFGFSGSARTAFAAMIFLTACSAKASDWPTEGGSNARAFASVDDLKMPLTAQWEVDAPAAPRLAWSSSEGRLMEGLKQAGRIRFDDAFRTVVAGGRVYFGSTVDHGVHCRDLATGKTVWSKFTGGPVRLSPAVYEGRVYFGSDDGRVYCVNAETGEDVWQRRVAPRDEWILARGEMISKWPVRTGVTIHDGVAYFGAGIFPHEDVYLYGVDPATGRTVWSQDNISVQDAGRNDLSPQGYLLAEEDLLFVPSGGSLPAVYDIGKKSLLHKRTHSWRGPAGRVGGTRALLSDGQLFTVGDEHILAMDQKTGNIGFGWFDSRFVAVQDDAAYIATGERVARLDRAVYLENSRKRRDLDAKIASLTREAYSAKGDKAEELKNQARELREELESIADIGIVWSTPAAADSALLVAGNVVVVGGVERVAAFAKDDGREVWTAEVEGTVRGLTVADGHLIASTDSGAIVCFGGDNTSSNGAAQLAAEDTASNEYRAAASQILENTGVKAGFCLVVGLETGELAESLARQSELKFYCIEPSAEKVEQARARFAAVGLHGHRIAVHQAEFDQIPYSNYFADLIVSETSMSTGQWPTSLNNIERHLRPQGGVLCLGRPVAQGELDEPALQKIAATSTLGDQLAPKTAPGWLVLTRGPLPGAGNWSHQYGNPANTAISSDKRIAGDLGVLWYGDPGPGEMVNRHEGAVGPLSVNGKLFVQGETTILAYDAYNGRHLWTYENPKALRTGVFQNQNPGNLAAGEDCLFHFIGDECYQVDMQTGETVATHKLPPGKDDGRYQWGYVAVQDGMLYGTATIRGELAAQMRRRGRKTDDATDGIFAIEIATGKHAWSYAGQSISHHTIAIGPTQVCFIDSSITSEQRADILREDKSKLAELTGEERELAERRLKDADVRMTVAVDAKTGEKLWERPVDVTDCSEIGIGGGKLTMMFADDTLILCGANANGHYWRQFVAGEFKERRMVALSAVNGYQLWAKDANYRHRPIIIGEKVLAEPWMYDLKTGEQLMRTHPITGEESPWSIMRTGHHCGMLTGSDSGMILFRSGATGFMDLNSDEGIRHFAGHRLGCWINAISANGLVMIPEASAGCVCQFSIASTIVMEPRETRRPWTIYSAVGAQTPVKHLAINFGAPGDRKDALGTIWFSYPRRDAYQQTSLDVRLDINPQLASGGGYESVNEVRVDANTETPWIYSSWAEGLQELTLPLLGEGDAPAKYTLKLHFADGRPTGTEPSTFDVLLNGNVVAENVTLAPGAENASISTSVQEFTGVDVTKDVQIKLNPKSGTPILNAVEAIRE